MDHAFWQGKRVFVTGHTGFKGGWLCLLLHRLGAQLYGYALQPPTTPALFDLARVGSVLQQQTIADVRDGGALRNAMKAAAPDIVIHLAAQPILRLSYTLPVETYETNVMGTVHVLESVRQVPSVRAVLNITSDKCYENKETHEAYKETDPMGGFDPYSSSKGCAELVAAAYARSYFSKGGACLASARAGNVIGGGDWAPDRLMTDIIAALSQNRAPVLRNPLSVRPWQHVLEPLSGYLRAIEYMWANSPPMPLAWNFGPDADSEVSVGHLAGEMCRLWKAGVEPVIEPDTGRLHEAGLLKLNSDKARRELGWQPRLSLTQALQMTVDWHRALLSGKDMHAVTLAQIDAYGKG